MKLVYLGSPEMSVPPLEAVLDAGHEVLLVVTNPPRRRGRRSEPTPSPVAALAADRGVPVSHDPDDILALDADLGVVVAFGRLIKPHVLAHLPMVNLHFSLLPRWRGAAPVERAILAGDTETGVCLMDVEQGLDAGGVYARRSVGIDGNTTAASLRAELVGLGTSMLLDALERPLGEPEPQPEEGVTYAAKLSTEDLALDWSRPATELARVVAVGGAWTTLGGRRLKVLQAEASDTDTNHQRVGAQVHPGELVGKVVACGKGVLELVRVQPAGKPAMEIEAFLNGARIEAGTRLPS